MADTSPAVLGDKAAQKKEAPALTVEEKGKRSHAAHGHTHTPESLCHTPKTNTTLRINYTSIKKIV